MQKKILHISIDDDHVYVTKYLFRCEICSVGTYFTENLFCQNFLNEILVPGTHFIGKFIPPTGM